MSQRSELLKLPDHRWILFDAGHTGGSVVRKVLLHVPLFLHGGRFLAGPATGSWIPMLLNQSGIFRSESLEGTSGGHEKYHFLPMDGLLPGLNYGPSMFRALRRLHSRCSSDGAHFEKLSHGSVLSLDVRHQCSGAPHRSRARGLFSVGRERLIP